jgi:hypothetical protein
MPMPFAVVVVTGEEAAAFPQRKNAATNNADKLRIGQLLGTTERYYVVRERDWHIHAATTAATARTKKWLKKHQVSGQFQGKWSSRLKSTSESIWARVPSTLFSHELAM